MTARWTPSAALGQTTGRDLRLMPRNRPLLTAAFASRGAPRGPGPCIYMSGGTRSSFEKKNKSFFLVAMCFFVLNCVLQYYVLDNTDIKKNKNAMRNSILNKGEIFIPASYTNSDHVPSLYDTKHKQVIFVPTVSVIRISRPPISLSTDNHGTLDERHKKGEKKILKLFQDSCRFRASPSAKEIWRERE